MIRGYDIEKARDTYSSNMKESGREISKFVDVIVRKIIFWCRFRFDYYK